MEQLQEIYEKVTRGQELSLDEYEYLRMQQELANDLVEIAEGRKRGLSADNFSFRMPGGGVIRTSGPSLAIVVGHTANSPGASGTHPINQSEYTWNKDSAQKIRAKCQDFRIESKIFYRDGIGISGAYRQVGEWGASCVVELHFNAYNGQARGTETLYDRDTHAGSRVWARKLQDKMLRALGLNDRSLKECDPGDRGYQSVSALNIPSALVEPFFGDNVQDAQIAVANEDELAIALAEAAAEHLAVA